MSSLIAPRFLLKKLDLHEVDAAVKDFAKAGGDPQFLAIALGWAVLGSRTPRASGLKLRGRRRLFQKALKRVARIRTALRDLRSIEDGHFIRREWSWWAGQEWPEEVSTCSVEERQWRQREARLLQLLKRPIRRQDRGRPPFFLRYCLLGALSPYMDLKKVGKNVAVEFTGKKVDPREWRNSWWQGLLTELEGKEEIRHYKRWFFGRALKPRDERSLQFILHGCSIYWNWVAPNGSAPDRATEVLREFLAKLPLKRLGYDKEMAMARVRGGSRVFRPDELKDLLTCR